MSGFDGALGGIPGGMPGADAAPDELDVRTDRDVATARRRTRDVAASAGVEQATAARLAAAVSELGRSAVAHGSGARVRFSRSTGVTARLQVEVETDLGTLAEEANGAAVTPESILSRVGRLVGKVDVLPCADAATCVRFSARLSPAPAASAPAASTPGDRPRAQASRSPATPSPTAAIRAVAAMPGEVERLREAVARVERELEETNRGVVAVYAELDDTAAELRRASELKSRFLSNVSHEFRTPLGSIRALAALLLDSALEVEQRRQVKYIAEAAQDLTSLVDDLLDLARVEAGRVTIQRTAFLVPDFLASLVEMVRPLVREGVTLELAVEPGLPPIETDSLRLGQIVRNFLSNAVKFTTRGSIEVQAACAPADALPAAARLDARIAQAGETGTFLVLSVRDTGIGIAATDLERIFEEFVQVEGPHQAAVKGTGLGLPLARRLAGLLGGGAWVTSDPGQGSTFAAAVPVTRIERAVTNAAGPAPDLAIPLPGSRTERRPAAPLVAGPGTGTAAAGNRSTTRESDPGAILVADDSEAMRYLVTEALEPIGRPVRTFAGGIPVLAAARGTPPALVVLDLEMPDMHGTEVARRLRADPRTREVPIVVHTALDLDDERRAALAAHAVGVVSKGDGLEALVASVRAALGGGA